MFGDIMELMFNVFSSRQHLSRDVTGETRSAQSVMVSRLVCLCLGVYECLMGISVEICHSQNQLTRLRASIVLTKQKN